MAAYAGQSQQATCCATGGHTFEIYEYTRGGVCVVEDIQPQPAPQPRPATDKPVSLPVMMNRLATLVASCTRCALAHTREKTVFARGNPEAPICIVGEAPGAEENRTGEPFVGRAGQMLDEMLREMGLDPQNDVYICNILKCQPPDNRRPTAGEIASCSLHLQEQLATWAGRSSKRVIVALGNTAARTLLGAPQGTGITELRGQWKLYRGRIMVMPTYHPSYLMKPFKTQAQSKAEARSDLQKVLDYIGLSRTQREERWRPRLYKIDGGKATKPEKTT